MTINSSVPYVLNIHNQSLKHVKTFWNYFLFYTIFLFLVFWYWGVSLLSGSQNSWPKWIWGIENEAIIGKESWKTPERLMSYCDILKGRDEMKNVWWALLLLVHNSPGLFSSSLGGCLVELGGSFDQVFGLGIHFLWLSIPSKGNFFWRLNQSCWVCHKLS